MLRPATLLKRDSDTVFSCEFSEIFKNIIFTEHPQKLLWTRQNCNKDTTSGHTHGQSGLWGSFLSPRTSTFSHIKLAWIWRNVKDFVEGEYEELVIMKLQSLMKHYDNQNNSKFRKIEKILKLGLIFQFLLNNESLSPRRHRT